MAQQVGDTLNGPLVDGALLNGFQLDAIIRLCCLLL